MRSLRRGALAIGLVAITPAMTGCPDAVRADGTGGLVTGSRASAKDVSVNLSEEGTLDWKHWGLGGTNDVNRKSGVTEQIGDFTILGNAQLIWVDCCDQQFSWSDGTPTGSTDDAARGVAVDTANLSGDGFRFSVAAEKSPRTLHLYSGNWCVRAKLEATLSDGSAEPFLDNTWDVPTPMHDVVEYEITYSSGSPAQALTIDLLVDDNHCTTDDVGEVWLLAATLHDG